MQYKVIDAINKKVSVLGCGCAPLMSRASKSESERLLKVAQDSGVTLFDTADFYGQGDSEKLLGRFVRQRREEFVIITKGGSTYRTSSGLLRFAKNLIRPLARRSKIVRSTARTALGKSTGDKCFEPAYLKTALDASLQRLKMDYVDLYLLHEPSLDEVRNRPTFDALADLKRSGKTRGYGVSSTVEVAVQAVKLYGDDMAAVEVPLSVNCAAEIMELTELCGLHKVSILAREPFDNGRLVAQVHSDVSAWLSLHKISMTQALLQYAFSYPHVSAVICGTVNKEHFEENAKAFSMPMLTAEQLESFRLLVKATEQAT